MSRGTSLWLLKSVEWNTAGSKVIIEVSYHWSIIGRKRCLQLPVKFIAWGAGGRGANLIKTLQGCGPGGSSFGTPAWKRSPGENVDQPPTTKSCVTLLKTSLGASQPSWVLFTVPSLNTSTSSDSAADSLTFQQGRNVFMSVVYICS